MPSKRMQELEEVSKELLKVLVSDWAGSLLQRSLDKRTRADDKLLGAQATAARLLRELTAAEETVARTLLERESELQRLLRRLRDLEQELERARESIMAPTSLSPIDIDGSRHSRCFVSDYLWSLVPTTW
ncbi:hypothetical protein Q9966_016695 [Columba livia]|nr:hypothetical protein Q9966_016695 [Columba livia]